MGLDELHLRVLAASSDNPKEKVNARKGKLYVVFQQSPMNAWLVLNIMQKGRHWILVVCLRHIEYIFAQPTFQVLLLGNVVGRYLHFSILLEIKLLLGCQRKLANFSRQCCACIVTSAILSLNFGP